MRAVFSAWFSAGLIAGLALLALEALAPSVEEGHPVDEYAQLSRVHLPWLLFCVLMALAAGSYVREWKAGLGRALVALPVPAVGGVTAALIGTPQADTLVVLGLHLLEAALGVVLGLALSRTLTARWDAGQEFARERGEWRRNR